MRVLLLLALPVQLFAAAGTGPLLLVAPPTAGTNLVRNAGFETVQGSTFPNWSASINGYKVAAGQGRSGTTAILCQTTNTSAWHGASQNLVLNRTTMAPLVVKGWSRAEGVSGGTDSDYSIYVDVVYQDGTPSWGHTAQFSAGTHEWQQRQVTIHPEKPIKSLTLYCLFRNHSGTAWFDDVEVTELVGQAGSFVFQGTPMLPGNITNSPAPVESWRQTGDGLRLGMNGQSVVAVEAGGRKLTGNSGGGFLVRDVAANSDVYGFTNGVCPELELSLQATVTEHTNHLRIEGRIQNLRGGDRAVLLLFALPIDATGWSWGDDMRRQRTIAGTSEFANLTTVDCGSTGGMSLYPVAGIWDTNTGISIALDMGAPAVYRLVYHPVTRQCFIAFDFGLVPETTNFPNGAEFRFVVFRSDPRWGFRSSLKKLMEIFPEFYEVRSREQGIWMAFTDVSTVQGWQDFGFKYHEGNNNVGWDDQNGVLSFRYTEPMTWWMPMSPELPRTEAEAIRVRDEYAAGPAGMRRDMALVTKSATMLDSEGHPALIFRNEPWANGAVWSLNPNPWLPAQPNAATVYWNTEARARYSPNASPKLDGEYLDSLEGYVTASLNYERAHFGPSTVPLSFAMGSYRPVLFKGLAIHEFTRWISDDVHRLGGLMFANSVPYRFSFLCPWLDVMGTETDWNPGGVYTPVSESQLCLWRAMSGAKPYLLLMNTDYSKFTTNLVEKYFLRSLAYGIFPSMFSHNAAENPYWQNPTWYNRDRPLFKKYVPIIKEVAQAGWQPIPAARVSDAALRLERFGAGGAKPVYFTLLNDTSQAKAVVLTPDQELLQSAAVATELISGQRLNGVSGGWAVTVPASSTVAIKVEPGPRFMQIRRNGTAVQLGIASPPELQHVLESSEDLRNWVAIQTNSSQTPSYMTELAADADRRFYRLRW